MLHTKFCGNQPAGSREEEFCWVFTINGHGGHLGHVTSIILLNFHLHLPKSLHTNLVKNSPPDSEKSKF